MTGRCAIGSDTTVFHLLGGVEVGCKPLGRPQTFLQKVRRLLPQGVPYAVIFQA